MFTDRDLRKLLIPLVLEQLLSGFMGIADTLMVARVGDTAISAVSCVDAINTLVLYLTSALAAGGTIVCAQYLGRKDRTNAARAGQQVFLVAFSLSLALMVLALVLRRFWLQLIFGRVEAAVMEQGVQYFFLTALSYPFLALQQTSAAQFRACGNSRLPMLVTAFANCTNIAGNAILIFGFGLGVRGAALATLGSRVINAVIVLIFQRDPSLDIPFRDYLSIRPDRRLILTVCRIAIPNGVENGMFQLGRLLVQSTVATLGTTAIAAQAMIYTLDSIQSMPGIAVGIGTLTVVGQCMGAGRVDEARKYTGKLCRICWYVVCAFSLVVIALCSRICALSGLSSEIAGLTFRFLAVITGAKLLMWIPAFCLPYSLRAAGDASFSAAVSAGSMWAFRVGLSALLCRVFGFGLSGVWIAWFTDWVCRLSFYITRFCGHKWETKNVIERRDG